MIDIKCGKSSYLSPLERAHLTYQKATITTNVKTWIVTQYYINISTHKINLFQDGLEKSDL